jgi:hypothetical protein
MCFHTFYVDYYYSSWPLETIDLLRLRLALAAADLVLLLTLVLCNILYGIHTGLSLLLTYFSFRDPLIRVLLITTAYYSQGPFILTD